MDADVNCLVTDPISYTARSGVGTSSSRSAEPYALRTRVSFPRTTPTDMPAARPPVSAALTMESTAVWIRARSGDPCAKVVVAERALSARTGRARCRMFACGSGLPENLPTVSPCSYEELTNAVPSPAYATTTPGADSRGRGEPTGPARATTRTPHQS